MARKIVKKKTPKNGLKWIIIVLSLVFTLILLYKFSPEIVSNLRTMYVAPTPYPTLMTQQPTPAGIPFYKSDWEKFQVDVSQPFFENNAYPSEIRNLSVANVRNMKCSPTIHIEHTGNQTNFTYQNTWSDKALPVPSQYQSFVGLLEEEGKSLAKADPLSVVQCLVDNEPLIMTQTVNGTSIFFQDYSMRDSKVAGFGSCNYPVAMTNDYSYYFLCAGGESGIILNIEKVNVRNNPMEVGGCASIMGEPTTCH